MSRSGTISTSIRARCGWSRSRLKLVDAELRDDPEANRLFLEILTSRKDPETTLAPDERGRRLRPLHPRFRPRRRADAIRHVPRYTVDEHTLFAIGILHQIEQGELKDELPLATAVVPTIALAPGALSRRAAARHRQGPRRRSFRAGREIALQARAAPRPQRRGDRDGRLAGALAPADEQHRLQARHRRSRRRSATFVERGAVARAAASCCWC